MIKFERIVTPSPEQWESAIMGMRNAHNSWDKSDTVFCNKYPSCKGCPHEAAVECPLDDLFEIGPNDWKLMMKLRNAGTDHRKFMRMLPVMVTITAPLYWWKEFDTYKIATVANSCSTMHTIHEKEFTWDDFSVEKLLCDRTAEDPMKVPMVTTYQAPMCGFSAREVFDMVINMLNANRLMYLETKDKVYWDNMIEILPTSYNQKRTVMMNYEVLANIYKSRRNHKLQEWHYLCDWAAALPYGELITGKEEE